ncbi:MAG: hypothetical protein A2Y97_12965 [Nitrospirae bacterium RBG_13_39_12]|nr:MAG: hypothetical protein A2Y97_12965 [Nitrospirae bacterium RBG_13_39_12]
MTIAVILLILDYILISHLLTIPFKYFTISIVIDLSLYVFLNELGYYLISFRSYFQLNRKA